MGKVSPGGGRGQGAGRSPAGGGKGKGKARVDKVVKAVKTLTGKAVPSSRAGGEASCSCRPRPPKMPMQG